MLGISIEGYVHNFTFLILHFIYTLSLHPYHNTLQFPSLHVLCPHLIPFHSDVEQVDPELADALKKAKLQEQPATSEEVLSIKPSGAAETKTDAGMSPFPSSIYVP